MGRFRVSEEDDQDENFFQAQHVYSSSDDDDTRGGFWRGPLVSMAPHCPQNSDNNNPMDLQNEHTLGGSPIQPPSVAIRRSRRDNNKDNNDDNYGGLQPHYFEYEQPPLPQPRTSPWFRIFLMAIIAHLLARYGPVAPPPEAGSDSWEDFWVRELRGLWRSAKLVGYTVPKYAFEWVAVGVYDDAQVMYHKYQTYREQQAQLQYWSNCSLTIPEEWNLELPNNVPDNKNEDSPKNDQHLYSIVGQSRAVQATTKALGAWAQSAPLLLYFAGSRGVGKLELARQISQRVFGHCLYNNDDDIEKLLSRGSGPVMMLQGQDFASYRDEEMEERDSDETTKSTESKETPTTTMSQRTKAIRIQLYEAVMRHAKLHPNGTVVILQHVEEMAEGLLPKLVQDLTNPSRYATASDEGYSSADERQSLAVRLQQTCEKTVFIMTSMVGSKSIARSIQTYGGTDNVDSLELELLLMHEIDVDFATRSSEQKQRTINSVEVGSKFNALAPFFPMEQPTLAQILSMKIYHWSRQQSTLPAPLRVTKQALDALLHESRVEYLTVMKKSTQTPLLTFSSAGGQFLRDGSTMMNGWQASVKKCFRNKRKARTTQAKSPDLSDDEAEDQNGQTTIFDYESWSQKAIIMTCPLIATRKDRYDSYSRPLLIVDRAACEETCRFGL